MIKQQLSSMLYVTALCDHFLAKHSTADEANELDNISLGKPGGALYNLPLDVTLRNNIALQFFIGKQQQQLIRII